MRQDEIAEAMTKYIEENHPAMSELSNWIADNNISKFDLAMIVVHQHTLLQKLETMNNVEAAEKAETERIGYKVRIGGQVFPPIKDPPKTALKQPATVKSKHIPHCPTNKRPIRKVKDARRANANNK